MMYIFSSGHLIIIPNADIMHVQYTDILDETCLNQSIARDTWDIFQHLVNCKRY